MPPVQLAVTDISRDGVTPPAETNGDATNNHVFTNDGNVFIQARNSGAGARAVTFVTPGTVDSLAVADNIQSLAAGVTQLFGPFPPSQYGSSVQINPEHAEVKLLAFRLPR